MSKQYMSPRSNTKRLLGQLQKKKHLNLKSSNQNARYDHVVDTLISQLSIDRKMHFLYQIAKM